jgi:23S rRNA (cytosine1962-C5)-methyltransferase
MPAYSEIRVRPGRERLPRAGRPWIFGNEVEPDEALAALAPGALVNVRLADGKPLGTATYNRQSLIAARIYDREPDATLDRAWFERRLQAALALRNRFYQKPLYRLVHAEGDGLPGFVCDRYGEVVVVQANTAGAEALTRDFLGALEDTIAPRTIVLRNNAGSRTLEGLERRVEVVRGSVEGPVEIEDRGARFPIDVLHGQKTGWYLDLAEARGRVGRLAAGARMLDLFCHAGAFSVIAAKAGAREVRGIDSSDLALELARQAAQRNGVESRTRFERADVFVALEAARAERHRYDIVVADPPSFVGARKDIKRGAAAYRKLARLASSVVSRGGFLFIASCSHNMSAELFGEEVAAGLAGSARIGRILMSGGAGPDHPVHAMLPETAYLKWLLLQLD